MKRATLPLDKNAVAAANAEVRDLVTPEGRPLDPHSELESHARSAWMAAYADAGGAVEGEADAAAPIGDPVACSCCPTDLATLFFRRVRVMKRFFATAADVLEDGGPPLAEKLRHATPHWTRHTHATHLLDGGAELTTVRDNLRHSSLATTSMYLHADDQRRAKQVADWFAAPLA